MTLHIPSRFARILLFTVAAASAGLLSAEALANTLCVLMVLVACCRGSIRVDIVLISLSAFGARHWSPDRATLKSAIAPVLTLLVALFGLFLITRPLFRARHPNLDDPARDNHRTPF